MIKRYIQIYGYYLLLFDGAGTVSLGMRVQADSITTGSLLRRFDHHFVEEDLEGIHATRG